MNMRKNWFRSVFAVTGAATLIAGLTACGSSDAGEAAGSGAGEGLPDTIKIMSIKEMTGPVAFAGENSTKGVDLAVEQINEQGFLGDTKLEIDLKDSSDSTQEAASFATQAVSDSSYAAILGPGLSAQASAISPIAEKGQIPVVYYQAGSEGVLVGDYTYRVTAPAGSYYPVIGDYLKDRKVETAAVLYNSGNPTLTELGEKTVPGVIEDNGVSIERSDGVAVDAQDFTAVSSQIANDAPDAVFVLLTGPQNPRAVSQLRQKGYEGEIIGMTTMGAGNLQTAGEEAAGVVWPSNFSARSEAPSTQEFVEAYQEKYDGEVPNNYAAEGYDTVWLLARGIKEADSAERTAIQEGIAKIAAEGFDGAQGPLAFEGNDVRVEGVLASWDGSEEIVLTLDGS
ncbi:ABC transporter substrate-binding protein [Thermobifida halotolerans]|uniref:ABC transporter substrate-binding protein n=2 Tax=Thermobifida halotolerans TaxID=483545 RepID=A0A399G420_9ACTN|nr:ABC transporter substrate-binding protein [Thermobifida halotolerans]UOE20886.1 ABC transporter substrate-binding protein [Thermobifida halotolerans]